MSTGLFEVPPAMNEPILGYAPGSPERESLERRIEELNRDTVEAPLYIDGKEVRSDETFDQPRPHRLADPAARVHAAGEEHIQASIDAALRAREEWSSLPWEERAAIFLRAADLVSGPWRDTLNASTIIGQSKSVHQAEIEAACELCDFLRFNAHFAEQIYRDQPLSPEGMWNRVDYRPLEGFVLAITPFNFTAIAGNLPTAPALLGNVVVWKPSEKQALSAHFFMEVLKACGLPDGVINLVHGDGALAADVATAHPELAGLHFTGSAAVLKDLWKKVGQNVDRYRNYPRIVAESGGKDFVVAHPSAEVEPLVVALGRGAFEYQGQKCSAASRAYIPRSLWPEVKEGIQEMVSEITVGNVEDLSTFMGAVIDAGAFQRHREAIEQAKSDGLEVVAGGGTDDSEGWFVQPTVLRTDDPRHDLMERELFGPIVTVYVYDDDKWSETLELVDTTSPYGLTGAVFSQDRSAVQEAHQRLRYAAGNFYVNDKPTGSVVGQQPFGGARASGTNDKAGSFLNLTRWLSPRAIKETHAPPRDWRYPHMG